ncbi:helix-turn-helix domain-containing protein [Brevibacillus sp. NPDC058079]|uniref:helix-turn-helix domain-containing protein n=1 Tax=Brevibacillus sp. NPDC058079 TaxID=3346330 RepID=UPI0036E24DCC
MNDPLKTKDKFLTYSTLGELIKKCREKLNLSLTELSNCAGITKGCLSRIENGDTKRPEFKTIKSIAQVLEIPYREILEYYVDLEHRADALLELLHEAVAFADMELVSKISLKMLESPQKDTYSLLEKLFHFAEEVELRQAKLVLYDNIVKYSREHGVMIYLAKGMLQKYLIERDDFSRLSSTYQYGKYGLQYVNFLSIEERLVLLFKLGVHAFNLRYYDECVDLCEQVIAADETQSRTKADSVGALCNAYFYLQRYDDVEKYLEIYREFPFPHIHDNATIMEAVLDGTKGHIEAAIIQLEACVKSETPTIHVINRLFELYLKKNDSQSIQELLKNESKIEHLNFITPYQKTELASFYKLKGDFILNQGHFDDAVDCYLKSALEYGKVDAHSQSHECLELIVDAYINNNKEMNVLVLRKLQKLYNELK